MKAKRCVIRAACLTLTAILLLLLAACSSLDAPAEVSVKIDDNGRMLSVKGSEDMTVGALLSRAKVSVGKKDLVTPPVKTVWGEISADAITVRRYADVVFTDGETSQEVRMVGGTVGEAFDLTVFDRSRYTMEESRDSMLRDGQRIVLIKKEPETTAPVTTEPSQPQTQPTEPKPTEPKPTEGLSVISDGAGGFLCAGADGTVDKGRCDGVTIDGVDWTVINGKAFRVENAWDRTLHAAARAVGSCTDSSMSKEEKLKSAFRFLQTSYLEGVRHDPPYREADWPVVCADDLFVYGKGDCFSYGAAFAFMGKAIGCDACYACNSGGHGWAEIEGLIYDPEWSMHSSKYAYYAMRYDEPCDVRYAAGIASGQWWMRMQV